MRARVLKVGGLPEVFLDVIQFFPGHCPPLCGLLANNFERMPAAALRDHNRDWYAQAARRYVNRSLVYSSLKTVDS